MPIPTNNPFTSNEVKANENKKESNPIVITRRSRAYILEYRNQSRIGQTQGRTRRKVFWFDGKLKEAVERSRNHCEIMGFTFIYCYPYIVDLEAQEELKMRTEKNYSTNEDVEDYELEEIS